VRAKVAVASKGSRGLKDEVSEVFGKTKVFTIIEIDEGKIKRVESVKNPAASYEYGAGPIAVKFLADLGVTFAVGSEFGVGVSAILEDKKIKAMKVPSGTKIEDVVNKIIKEGEK